MGQRSGNTSAGKGPALSGVMMVDTVRGKLRIRAWPKKRGDQGEVIRALNDRFRQNHHAWRYLHPDTQAAWMEATAGTPYLPRDIFTSFNYGRAIYWHDPITGKAMYPVQFMESVSQSLDAISQDPGAILVRGEDFWYAIPPGALGEVLTQSETDGLPHPAWAPGGGGGGGANWSLLSTINISSPVAAVEFLNLAAFSEIMVVGRDITASGSASRGVQFSSDNGSTWDDDVDHYIIMDANGVEATASYGAFVPIGATTSNARSLIMPMGMWKDATVKIGDNGNRARWLIYDNPVACNALRVFPYTTGGPSGTLNAGSISLFVR